MEFFVIRFIILVKCVLRIILIPKHICGICVKRNTETIQIRHGIMLQNYGIEIIFVQRIFFFNSSLFGCCPIPHIINRHGAIWILKIAIEFCSGFFCCIILIECPTSECFTIFKFTYARIIKDQLQRFCFVAVLYICSGKKSIPVIKIHFHTGFFMLTFNNRVHGEGTGIEAEFAVGDVLCDHISLGCGCGG